MKGGRAVMHGQADLQGSPCRKMCGGNSRPAWLLVSKLWKPA